MGKTIQNTILLIAFTILSCTSGQSNKEDPDRGYIVNIGQAAPDFTVNLTDGSLFNLAEQRGKVVMLQFTASWCGVCRKEIPHIENEIWQPLKEKGLVLVGIDRKESMATAMEFARKMKISYPLAPDPESEIFTLYARKDAGVTRNVIIDKEGKIVFLTRLFDKDEFNEMVEVIKRVMEE
jgi:peroxiredoxin